MEDSNNFRLRVTFLHANIQRLIKEIPADEG